MHPLAARLHSAAAIHLCVSLLNNLCDPLFDAVEQAGFKSLVNACLLPLAAFQIFIFYYFFCQWSALVGPNHLTEWVSMTLSQPYTDNLI